MQRRELLKVIGAAAALPFVPRAAEAALQAGQSLHARIAATAPAGAAPALRTLNAHQGALVTTIAEMIIPRTDTPGATDARVTEFIDLLLTEWYPDAERDRFVAGLDQIDERSRAANGGRDFLALAAPERVAVLKTLDAARRDQAGAGFAFGRLKELTVYGYFTSEPVSKRVLKTQIMFPSFEGCVAT